MVAQTDLKHFYIPDEQSIYLLSHKDAKKLKDWFKLCTEQLERLGYQEIELIGKGAFGFAFAGKPSYDTSKQYVFKFSRANLPQHVQDRLEEEAYMLGHVAHPYVPSLIEFQRIKKQSILVMQRATGKDMEKVSLELGPLSPRLVVKIAVQLADILQTLRAFSENGQPKPIVHGDVKPSNIVFDPLTEKVGLIDWGSSVFAQLDAQGNYLANNVMDLMSSDMQQTNARLGDVYFIGPEQLSGNLSSPRFDEQGLASTLYALASGQSSRFGAQVIRPNALGLPKMLGEILTAMLSDDAQKRAQGGDYLLNNIQHLKNLVFSAEDPPQAPALIPGWSHQKSREIDTVVYSSRKSFLRAEGEQSTEELRYLNDEQFERYYKNYLQGMGETEKAFISEVSRLGKYPVVGGLAVRWTPQGVYIDSSLNVYDPKLKSSFDATVNNIVTLARSIHRVGVFKSCMFNARDTLHIEREDENTPFVPSSDMCIPYELNKVSVQEDQSRMHSYFEDGDDPDELLTLPDDLMTIIHQLNGIHHTGCIIFEALPKHLKIHSYYTLLDHSSADEFKYLLSKIIELVPMIQGVGMSGFMKLPYKDTRFFEHQAHLPDKFYPRNPYAERATGS
ncbi:MAG: serine/threonine protein kinase [Alteromonadaceae bacterium]|uniref:protein kinase domain-containing protein n=1 Tax=Paraglaciecola chathamensis TaxID=368405 RepID=UPI000C6B3ACF|nr:protein kinase [Paraglaciecola agarilytica]MBN26153.1 serine/threonine protein kinase [Alteromonadaceae bacterium]|tara:strand:- start:12087 stop:13937 length:1851 start_codon:yes stop_codon:yes gene_type:complete